MSPDLDVAIVGGGHNGLTAAWYLAHAGLRVAIFERRSFVGGAAITEELWPGYRFSTCAHMVHALDPGIQADLRLEERGLVGIPRTGALVPVSGGDYWGPADHESPRNLSLQLTAEETGAERLVPPELTRAQLRRRVSALVTEVSCYKLLAAVDELPHWRAWDGDPALPSRGVVGLGRSEASVDAASADCAAGRPPAEPIINFSVPSALDPTLAPEGRHTASVWIYPAPARLRDTDWDTVRDRVAEGLVEQITRHAPNFRRSILHLKLRTPADLERENGLTDGCIWHIQHGGDQLFWNRPLPELSRYRGPFPGLYLCGAGQHPGGEISGIPGHNAAQEVIRDLT